VKVEYRIARRYMRPGKRPGIKGKMGAIQWIQGVSIAGVGVGAAALILVLSAFNGLEDLVRSFYDRFDPDVKVVPVLGKTFAVSEVEWTALQRIPGIDRASRVLEDKILLKHGDYERIGVFKGVDSSYGAVNALSDCIVAGSYTPNRPESGLLGIGLAYRLGYHPQESEAGLLLFVPKRGMPGPADWIDSYRSLRFAPQAIFSVQPEFDDVFAMGSLEMAHTLFDRTSNEVSALEFRLEPGASLYSVKTAIAKSLKADVRVLDRDEQQSTVFKVLKSEGLLTYLILALTLGIACFTLFGTLSMAMLEKKSELFSLWTLGMERSALQRIFLLRGLQITAWGGGLGLLIGALLVFAQDRFHWVRLGSGYAVDAYPVRLAADDVLLVLGTLLLLGGLVSWLGSRGVPRFGHTAMRRLD